MKSFSELGINIKKEGFFTGPKIKILEVLNKEIVVIDFKIEPSKHNSGDCLHLQIEDKGMRRVLFTGSGVLIELIKQVPKSEFPFKTVIVLDNDRYEFT